MNVELPGGGNLFPLYQEYIKLAADLKEAKEGLGMKPGIESEVVFDKAATGLYDNESLGRLGGTFASLSRALLDESSRDASEIAKQQADTEQRKTIGMVATGAGVVGGVVGNMVVNKNAPKERSAEITRQYEDDKRTLEREIRDYESKLVELLEENKDKIKQFEEKISIYINTSKSEP